MRCYKVSCEDAGKSHVRYVGTNADSRAQRQEYVDALGIKKKDVTIEEVEIPVAKQLLLDWINEHLNAE